MTKIRVAFPTALLSAFALSTAALAQTPTTAPPMNKPGAAPAPAPAMGAHQAPVVTNPAGMAPPAKGSPSSAPAPGSAAPSMATGTAAAGGPPAMPTPNKDMEAFMKGFEGSWRCDTKFAAGSMGPGSPEVNTKSTVRIKKEFGGFSWHGEFNVPKSKTMPAMSGVFQIAHESGSNGATIVGYDSMGSSFMGTGTISGDSATFSEEGYMMGSKTKVRETMTKVGPKNVLHKYEMDMGKGLQPMGEDNCKK